MATVGPRKTHNQCGSPEPRHCRGSQDSLQSWVFTKPTALLWFFLFLGAFLFFLQDKMGKLPFLGRLDGKLQIVKKFDCGISIFFKKINKKKRKGKKKKEKGRNCPKPPSRH
jgi:hypothetical protein